MTDIKEKAAVFISKAKAMGFLNAIKSYAKLNDEEDPSGDGAGKTDVEMSKSKANGRSDERRNDATMNNGPGIESSDKLDGASTPTVMPTVSIEEPPVDNDEVEETSGLNNEMDGTLIHSRFGVCPYCFEVFTKH
jgi:hypothetical protein